MQALMRWWTSRVPITGEQLECAVASQARYFMGLYSGAGADGIDAAVIELRGRPDGKLLFVDSVTGDAFTEQVLAGGVDLLAGLHGWMDPVAEITITRLD